LTIPQTGVVSYRVRRFDHPACEYRLYFPMVWRQ
jgi:hypothetical protein